MNRDWVKGLVLALVGVLLVVSGIAAMLLGFGWTPTVGVGSPTPTPTFTPVQLPTLEVAP